MFYTDKTIVFYDGKFCKIKDVKNSPYTQGLHYGNSVFEGIRAYATTNGTKIFKAGEHFARLQQSAEVMAIPCRYTPAEMEQIAYELLEQNHLKDAYIRPLLFCSEGMRLESAQESVLFMATWKWGRYFYTEEEPDVCISSIEKPSPKAMPINHKISGLYVNAILANNEARRKGYDEAIQLDAQGFLAQAPSSNLFLEKKGELFTPTTPNILAGITRRTIIHLAKENDLVVHETNLTVEDFRKADAAFLTGTAVQITPIGALEGKKFAIKGEKALSNRLAKLYGEAVRTGYEPAYTII